MRALWALLIFIGVTKTVHAQTPPPLEAFGAPPSIFDVAISPDGKNIALIQRQGEISAVYVQNLETKQFQGLAAAEDLKPRRLDWADNQHVLFWASETTRNRNFRSSLIEFGAVFSVGVNGQKAVQLLRRGDEVAVNSSASNIISMNIDDPETVLMAAFGESRSGDKFAGRVYSIFEVNLENGRAKLRKRGGRHTRRFIVDEYGELFARIDHDQERDDWSIVAYDGNKTRTIYEDKNAAIAPMIVHGLTPDKTALVVSDGFGNTDVVRNVSLASGDFSPPVFTKTGSSLDGDVEDRRGGVIRAVNYFDIEGPEYKFYDQKLMRTYQGAAKYLEGATTRISSVSDDFNRMVLYAEGGNTAGMYYVYDAPSDTFIAAYRSRDDIPGDYVAPTFKLEYKARDGQSIEGVLTTSIGGQQQGLPMIVMPHGGPAAADDMGWNWRAQYFANQGYLIFQPNFRGSSGYGPAFESAGYGEWGRGGMQHDITDGVRGMINSGFADPDRICIIGGSYGGYAALAGGAFTPGLYQCIGAIAPVSDLRRMLTDERRAAGADSWVIAYWKGLMTGPEAETRITEISPARYAESFTAPVMLLHGDDDTIVPIAQSRVMARALNRADKEVEFITLKDEDHWLSNEATRIQALRELDRFVKEHIGAN